MSYFDQFESYENDYDYDYDQDDFYNSNFFYRSCKSQHYTKSVQCFKCKQRGHYANYCTKKVTQCFNCKQQGHLRPNCPSLRYSFQQTQNFVRQQQTQNPHTNLPSAFSVLNHNTSTSIQNTIVFKNLSLQQLYSSFSEKERKEELETMKKLDEIFSQHLNIEENQKPISQMNYNIAFINIQNDQNKESVQTQSSIIPKQSKKEQKNQQKTSEKLENLKQQPSETDEINQNGKESNANQFQFNALEFANQILQNIQK
ncbi:hypothetical protein ABPG72_012282 [Tetrahymena utriculariae]